MLALRALIYFVAGNVGKLKNPIIKVKVRPEYRIVLCPDLK
jgi:hypothetical protein